MSEQQSLQELEARIENIRKQFAERQDAILAELSDRGVEDLRVHFLGRKGTVSGLMELLKSISKDLRPEAGKLINSLRQEVESGLQALKTKAASAAIDQALAKGGIDISLEPSRAKQSGSLHPVSLMKRVLTEEFHRLGFSIFEGPEADFDFYNFASLNFKDDHPARDMQDTFFVKEFDKMVLRTHTSNIQIHAMLQERPPLRLVALGRTYRCDSDLTHTPMFHQVEGLVVDRNISMADMKGVVDRFLKAIYGQDLETRLRPSYFPFVEPGGEVDLQCVSCRGKGCRICKMTGWLEIGGLGMVHPNVFEAVGIDSEEYCGFAFGFGIDRMAMLRYGLGDLRQLFEGNQDFLSQFPVFP